MAQRSFSLPALKLTKHHKPGNRTVSYLHRTLPGGNADAAKEDSSSAAINDVQLLQPSQCQNDMVMVEPTAYELERKSSVAGWDHVRKHILSALVKTAGRLRVDKRILRT